MKKTIILILTAIFILLIIISYNIYSNIELRKLIQDNNKKFESFYNIEILGTDIASLMNRIDDENTKNHIEKDEKGNYIDNNKNSIKADIKFLELEESIPIERILKQGINQFVSNFATMRFKCTSIEYHDKTNRIKYMFIEQIE